MSNAGGRNINGYQAGQLECLWPQQAFWFAPYWRHGGCNQQSESHPGGPLGWGPGGEGAQEAGGQVDGEHGHTVHGFQYQKLGLKQ